MQISKGSLLTDIEKESVSKLLLPGRTSKEDDGDRTGSIAGSTSRQQEHGKELSYTEKLALRTKQQKNTSDDIAKQYINLDILLSGTSTGMSFGGDTAPQHAFDNDDEVFY